MMAALAPASANSKSAKLWKSAKSRIFKHKRPLSESGNHHSPGPDEEDDFPAFDYSPSPRCVAEPAVDLSTPPKPVASGRGAADGAGPRGASLALPNMTHKRTSKATTCTASTALSTVNTAPSFAATTPDGAAAHPGSRRGGAPLARPSADELSHSCAASTAWTGNFAPSPAEKGGGGGAKGGAPGLPPIEKRGSPGAASAPSAGGASAAAGPEKRGGGGARAEKKAEEEESDGFAELITERQRSRRYSVSENKESNQVSNTSSKPADNNQTRDAPLEVLSQGYYAQGYNLLAFHQNNPFLSQGNENTRENVAQPPQAQQETSVSKNNDVAIETKKSESPDEPPSTQRKSVDAEFFMEQQVLPPSPLGKTRDRQHQHQARKEQQQKAVQQHLSQKQRRAQHDDDDYDNPNHLYAEINIKTRPHPLTRQGSEGSASLAMTSISSITGHGSLFAKDGGREGDAGLAPPSGGFWRIGSTAVETGAAEENYFDYSNDDTLGGHRRERSEGLVDRLASAVNQIFHSTCQCFEVGGGPVPMSPPVVKRESSGSLGGVDANETTVNGTNNAVVTVTTQGGNESAPTFSLPMEN